MRQIAIIGPYRLHNFGDDLIGAVLASHLHRDLGLSASIPGLSPKNAAWLGTRYSTRATTTVCRSRGLVVGGGGILGDSGSRPDAKYLWAGASAAALARTLGQRVVVTGVGAGPLALARSRALCRVLCALAESIGVRDEESRTFLSRDLGIDEAKIVVGADVALVWPSKLKIMPVASGRMGLQCDVAGFVDPSTARQRDILLSTLVSHCLRNTADTVLVSNGPYEPPLRALLPDHSATLQYRTLQTFLPHLAGLRAIVTTHLHLAIAAYASRVPCFSVYVREKTGRFYAQIGRPERAFPLEETSESRLEQLLKDAAGAEWTAEDEARRDLLCDRAAALLALMCRLSEPRSKSDQSPPAI